MYQRWCWRTNIAYHNETPKLELQEVGESLCSSSLVKAHTPGKSQPGVPHGNMSQAGKHGFDFCHCVDYIGKWERNSMRLALLWKENLVQYDFTYNLLVTISMILVIDFVNRHHFYYYYQNIDNQSIIFNEFIILYCIKNHHKACV